VKLKSKRRIWLKPFKACLLAFLPGYGWRPMEQTKPERRLSFHASLIHLQSNLDAFSRLKGF
jgi:hypothetical protein